MHENIGAQRKLLGRIIDRTPYTESSTDPANYAYEPQDWNGVEFEPGPKFWRRDQAYEFLTGEPMHGLHNSRGEQA